MAWNPVQYLKFAGPRLRPAVDLLNRVEVGTPPGPVFDLGCGTGAIAAMLAERFPASRVVGVDADEAMLAAARADHPGIDFRVGDIARFVPDTPAGLIYSNAALHWLSDHDRLFPGLMEGLAPGGVLAVQMPQVAGSPRAERMKDLAADPRWADRLLPLIFPGAHPPEYYYGLLAPRSASLDIWETEYLHVLAGENPVVEWSKGSGARPLLDALTDEEREDFLSRYSGMMAEAYPRRADGTTLLPFRRIFIVATRGENAAGRG